MGYEGFKKRYAAITAIGGYLPEERRTNADLEKITDTSDEWIVQRTGIRERRILQDGLGTSVMIVKAVEDLLKHYPSDVKQVDAVIVATPTQDIMFLFTVNILAAQINVR